MAQAQPNNHPSAQGAQKPFKLGLLPVENGTLPPHLVTKAKRGAVLTAAIAAGKKELEALKLEFEGIFNTNDIRELKDASGNVLVRYNHGTPNRLDQAALTAAHPKIVKEFTWPHPYDAVAFGS